MGDKRRMEEEKVLYAIEMMEAMKKASFSGSCSSQEPTNNAVCLTASWPPVETVAIGGYCYVCTKEDVDKMGPCYGCLMGAMKKASFSGSWSSQESMSNAVCLTDSWGPVKTVVIGGYCYVRTKEDVDQMGPYYGCLMGANDVELENEMPEKGGPDLPECQGGAG